MRMTLFIFFFFFSLFFGSIAYGDVYKWVDEKGTLHFTDDLSKIPERYRPDVEILKGTKRKETIEVSPSSPKEKTPTPPPKKDDHQEVEVDLIRKHEIFLTEVILNGRLKQYFVVDTGASFTLISQPTATELGILIDETTPFLRVSSVSDILLTPLITLKSIRVGKAELQDVEALIYTMPNYQGLLGNSFLNKFKVTIDSLNGKMRLYSLKGIPSLDRPGGYSKDYWVSQFRFYHRTLEELKRLKSIYEGRSTSTKELMRINNGIRYFEYQLGELERKASLAGVPRNWRE
jgi:clan AA aspartic protease (TIGR02281 family)